LQLLDRIQRIGKVECVVSAGDANLLVRCLLHRKLPIPAPAQGAEPHTAMLLIRAASFAIACGTFRSVDGEPWIGLMARGAAPAFEHFHSWMDLLLDELCLTRPAPV